MTTNFVFFSMAVKLPRWNAVETSLPHLTISSIISDLMSFTSDFPRQRVHPLMFISGELLCLFN